jgi:indole-3-glycerol phosphate synthase
MNILERIIAEKRKEVEERKASRPVSALESMPLFSQPRYSLKQSILNPDRSGIIAEFKRRSPSKGIINDAVTVEDVTRGYAQGGASAISVLTDTPFFGGALEDLAAATFNKVPLLRKDFTVDEYQLIEARAYGASAILLIAACLTPGSVKSLARASRALGLEVLLELHEEAELEHICPEVDVVGINNRNLKTFVVDIEHSIRMCRKIGDGFVKVSESGLNDVQTVVTLKRSGFNGFLIGENFMKAPDPAIAFADFVQQLKQQS